MLNVTEKTKESFRDWKGSNTVTFYFPDIQLTLRNESIDEESIELTEGIMTNKNVEFVGCISSCLKAKLIGVNMPLKGQRVEVSIKNSETTETIRLFYGIVDSAPKTNESERKDIIAYDELYRLSQIDISEWYNSHAQCSLADLRADFCDYVGIEQETSNLVNDSMVVCDNGSNISKASALVLLKAICQINGAFGRINREGKLEYVYIKEESQIVGFYPSTTTFPSNKLFPGVMVQSAQGNTDSMIIDNYASVKYEDYAVKVVDRIVIRDTENDDGISYGDGTNTYVIQGNVLAYGKSQSELQTIAKNIYDAVADFSFTPFIGQNVGFPYLLVGDSVMYKYVNYQSELPNSMRFVIMNRTLKGIHALWDVFEASGSEEQKVFISDLKINYEQLKQFTQNVVKDYTYSKNEIDTKVWFEVVNSKPSRFEPNKIYFVRK